MLYRLALVLESESKSNHTYHMSEEVMCRLKQPEKPIKSRARFLNRASAVRARPVPYRRPASQAGLFVICFPYLCTVSSDDSSSDSNALRQAWTAVYLDDSWLPLA